MLEQLFWRTPPNCPGGAGLSVVVRSAGFNLQSFALPIPNGALRATTANPLRERRNNIIEQIYPKQ